jgi:hypothetical protein
MNRQSPPSQSLSQEPMPSQTQVSPSSQTSSALPQAATVRSAAQAIDPNQEEKARFMPCFEHGSCRPGVVLVRALGLRRDNGA